PASARVTFPPTARCWPVCWRAIRCCPCAATRRRSAGASSSRCSRPGGRDVCRWGSTRRGPTAARRWGPGGVARGCRAEPRAPGPGCAPLLRRAGCGRRSQVPLDPVLAPVLLEPVDLLVAQAQHQAPVVETGILRKYRQLGCDVDPEPGGLDSEEAVVEEAVDVAAEHESAVLEVRAELGVAGEVPGLQHPGRRATRERAGAALGCEQSLPELTLASAHPDQGLREPLWHLHLRP